MTKPKATEANVETITPPIAAMLLDTSTGNRRIRPQYVDILAGAMERGEWVVTNQGIAIDTEGHLRDGHHRLSACVQSKKPFQTLVVRGVSPEAYEVIDCGLKRSYGDRLGISEGVANVLAMAARVAESLNAPTPQQFHQYINSPLGKAVEEIESFCPTRRAVFSAALSRLAACVNMIARKEHKGYVLNQYRALCLLDFDNMSQASVGLVKQAQMGNISHSNRNSVFVRFLLAYDIRNRDSITVRMTDAKVEQTLWFARNIIRESVGLPVSDSKIEIKSRSVSTKVDVAFD